MKKYNVINCKNVDAEYQSAKIIELNHIANEFAEANELKKLELSLQLGIYAQTSARALLDSLNEELEKLK